MVGPRPFVAGARAVRAPATGTSERGAVTAEAAMVLPLLVGMTIGLVWLLSLAVTQVRVTDAAREVARALARDESRGSAVELGRKVAPEGARFSVRQEGRAWVVHVSAGVLGPGGLFRFVPEVVVDADAVAAMEGR